MDHYKETHETWNNIASLYEEKFMDLDLYNDTYDSFLKELKIPNAHILEIGCGPGNITKYLLGKNPKLNIFGIDNSENMLKIARTHNPTAEFSNMDCRNINQLTETYHGIMCGFCLPYLSTTDCITFLADCKPLLKKNGILYLSFVKGNPDESGYISGNTGDRTYFNFYQNGFIKNQLTNNGFTVVHEPSISYNLPEGEKEEHAVIVCRK